MKSRPRVVLPAATVASLLVAPAMAQSFVDLTEVRRAPRPYSSVLEIEAGAIGTIASDEDLTVGLESDISWDGHLYYRDDAFGQGRNLLEGYAGRDGIYLGLADGSLVGDDTTSRLEIRARPWQFYRDGFYRDDSLVPNGFYEGSDYEAYAGFGREAQPGLYVELGPFYRKSKFSESDLTTPGFAIPEDYDAYGARLYLEQSNLQMDRQRGMPQEGYVLTLCGEREWNDSSGSIGSAGFATELPSAVWRARGRLEWYIPSSDDATWEVFARGGWHDETDRVQNFEAQRPLGDRWGDAQVRLRINFGDTVTLAPFLHGQFSHVDSDDPSADEKKFFFGGGADAYLHFSDSISLHGYYSYLDNENRPSIRVDQDVHGEHMFFLGMLVRFGAQRQ